MNAEAQRLVRNAIERPSGCIEHQNAASTNGYPQGIVRGRVGTVARLLWIEVNGPIAPGLVVRHRCNNKLCVRIEHLVLGTHQDNMDDLARTRSHPRRKLTSEQAAQAKRMLADGATQRAVAAAFGINTHAVWHMKHGRTYRHD